MLWIRAAVAWHSPGSHAASVKSTGYSSTIDRDIALVVDGKKIESDGLHRRYRHKGYSDVARDGWPQNLFAEDGTDLGAFWRTSVIDGTVVRLPEGAHQLSMEIVGIGVEHVAEGWMSIEYL